MERGGGGHPPTDVTLTESADWPTVVNRQAIAGGYPPTANHQSPTANRLWAHTGHWPGTGDGLWAIFEGQRGCDAPPTHLVTLQPPPTTLHPQLGTLQPPLVAIHAPCITHQSPNLGFLPWAPWAFPLPP